MVTVFRRCCDVCDRTVDWRESKNDPDVEFFHTEDGTDLCIGAVVALEVKEMEKADD